MLFWGLPCGLSSAAQLSTSALRSRRPFLLWYRRISMRLYHSTTSTASPYKGFRLGRLACEIQKLSGLFSYCKFYVICNLSWFLKWKILPNWNYSHFIYPALTHWATDMSLRWSLVLFSVEFAFSNLSIIPWLRRSRISIATKHQLWIELRKEWHLSQIWFTLTHYFNNIDSRKLIQQNALPQIFKCIWTPDY